MVAETEYYDLLGLKPTATADEIKKAYRRQALRLHPDKNPGNAEAEQQFQAVAQAYQVLSDEGLRQNYDKFGSEGAKPSAGFEDPSELFNMIFGGNAFMDWVGELALMKDIADMASVAQKDEEEDADAAAAAAASAAKDRGAAVDTDADATRAPSSGSKAGATTTKDKDEITDKLKSFDINIAPSDSEAKPPKAPVRLALTDKAHNPDGEGDQVVDTEDSFAEKLKNKKNAEELQRLQEEERRELEEQRKKIREERVETLTKKLVDRLSIFTESERDEQSRDSFKAKFRAEAETLKLESFGLNILHLIGEVYTTRAKRFLGMTRFAWLTSKWSGIKDIWGIVTTTFDVQRSIATLAKMEEDGGEEWTEEKKGEMEAEVTAKVLSAAWLGSRYEIQSILREVINAALHDETVPEETRAYRALGMLLIGEVFSEVKRDPEDVGGYMAFEQLVAESAAKKKEKKEKEKERRKWRNPFRKASTPPEPSAGVKEAAAAAATASEPLAAGPS